MSTRPETRPSTSAQGASLEQMGAWVDAAPNAQLMVDRDGMVLSFNPHAATLFGYSREEMVGRRFDDLLPPEMRAAHADHCRAFFSQPRQRLMGSGGTFVGQRKDGTRLDLKIGLSFLESQAGVIAIASIIDVTQQKRAENEAKQLTADLVRTNEELNDFTYIVSHDLREPLRGIRSYAQFLVEDYGTQLGDDAKDKFANLIRLADRLDQLVLKLLDYSRHGRVELDLKQVDLNDVLEDAMIDLSTAIKESGAEIRIPRPLPTLRGDRSMLVELYANLIGNALKYSDKEERWVEIGFERGASPARSTETLGHHMPLSDEAVRTVFYVKDNGIGIPEEHWGSVFRVFRRLHPRNAFGGGSGAGLTIAKKIVERHRGSIWLESTVGEGSTFYFTLGADEREAKTHGAAH